MGNEPLAGVRILDLTQVFSGPFATMTLSFLGAEVIKIENRSRSMQARSRQALLAKGLKNNYIPAHAVNLGKLSLNLDLRTPQGVELLYQAVDICDLVVENFRPGVMERLGISYEQLTERNPTIILVSSSGAGAEGPESRYMGYAHGFAAMGGISEITGYADGPPTEFRSGMDMRVGHAILFASLAALLHRRQTGEGQWIDLSSREVATALIGDVIVSQSMDDKPISRQSNKHPWMAPHNCYPCLGEDSWISIAISTEEEWGALRDVIDDPALSSDSGFNDGYYRWANQEKLDQIIANWTSTFPAFSLMQILQNRGIAAVPSYRSDDIYNDAHLQSRGLSTEVNHSEAGLEMVLNPPWKFNNSNTGVFGPAPAVGEHTNPILKEMFGISDSTINDLEKMGVIP